MSAHGRHSDSPYRRAICPVCKREVAAYSPTLGDGTYHVYRSHFIPNTRDTCEGWAMRVKPDAFVEVTP